MDKLVAQYSRQPDQNEFYSEQEQQDLTESLPPLSLKFSLPPVDNVSFRMPTLPLTLCRLDGDAGEDAACPDTSLDLLPLPQLCGNRSSQLDEQAANE